MSNSSNFEEKAIVGVILLCIILFFASRGYSETPEEVHSDSEYNAFCDEKLFYKPYVRIMEGRHGPMIKDSGPGFIELTDMEDLYVCANGLVFFYFRIIRNSNGEVYDDAVMQYASHYCGFFNGKPGPGIDERAITLYAILLVGNANDYRKISIQMFTAPWFNRTSRTTTNFTSLAIINTGGECILQRGKANIRIKANPATPAKNSSSGDADQGSNSTETDPTDEKDEPFITICRLDVNILLRNPNNAPLDTELTTTEEALLALKLSDARELRLRGCYEYPLIDTVQFMIVKDRVNEAKDSRNRIDLENSELNPEDGSTLKFWTTERLEKYGSPIKEPENSSLDSEVEAANASYHEEMAKPHKSRDKQKLKEDKEVLDFALFKSKLSEFLQNYKALYDAAKEYGEKAESTWTEVHDAMFDESVQQLRDKYLKSLEKLAQMDHDILFSAYSKNLLEKKMAKLKKNNEELHAALRKKTFQIAPKITRAEIFSAKAKSYLKLATKKMDRIKKIIEEYERHKEIPQKLMLATSEPAIVTDMLISIKNPSAENGSAKDPMPCLTFARKADQCKTAKPPADRACHIAMNSIGGGESAEWPGGAINEWRDEVFDLMTNIFQKACPQLESGFAEAINRIVRGYLMKSPEGVHGGSGVVAIPGAPYIEPMLQNYVTNYKIETETDLFPALKPKDHAVWDHVIEGLKECKRNVKPLKFEFSGIRPIKVTLNGQEVPINKEKADMEFAFNWAIDANFKIFATVLGSCFKELGRAQAEQFYEGYSADFLDPIRPIWLSNRDNTIFKVALGRYMMSGKGDLFSKYCMESSFVQSGEEEMRPLRKLLVNSYTEPNYFVEGPLEDTRGEYTLNF